MCLHGGRATRESIQRLLNHKGIVPNEELTPFHMEGKSRLHALDILPSLESPLAVQWALGAFRGATPGPLTALAKPFLKYLLRAPRVQLWGPVNAGKSSLLNVLCGRELARSGPEPGLTRDVIEGSFIHRGVKVRVFDAPGQMSDAIGLDRAALDLAEHWRAEADLTLELVPPGHAPTHKGLTVYSQADRDPQGRQPGISVEWPDSVLALKDMLVQTLLGPVLDVPSGQQVL